MVKLFDDIGVGPIDEAEAFFESRQQWSFETFGPATERGALGPLKHLEKEVREAIDEAVIDKLIAPERKRKKEYLLEELVDLRFLVEDAVSRAGFTYSEFMDACWAKLEKNRKRKWNQPSADGVVEHIRE